MKIKRRKVIRLTLLLCFVIGLFYGWYEYRIFMAVPTTRLLAGSYYPEMPPDHHQIYIQLPIDHQNKSFGNFTDFYLLSPNFKPGDPVVFQLYDNQQEAVGLIKTAGDFKEFDNRIGKGISYVLIGNRGVSPTLFPEVFNKDGKQNYKLALKLYGSDEQIEDIEFVRQDMARRGLLPKDGKIMLYGGSGGGVLIQQYISKYGEHVSRALVESTGAPDIAHKNGMTFTNPFYSSNPAAAESYYRLLKEGKGSPNLAFLLFKLGIDGKVQSQTDILKGENSFFDFSDRFLYIKNWLSISQNFSVINTIFRSPSELEVKVRIWELIGADLVNYHPASAKEVNLLYEWGRVIMADFLDAYKMGKIKVYEFNINRAGYSGDMMVWANTGDQDFGPHIGRLIGAAYPYSKLAIFEEASHHVQTRSEYQLGFVRAFFNSGLNAVETQRYFNDARQKNK
jgi:pimeloyl-ACP methyl ester carboxylesterase